MWFRVLLASIGAIALMARPAIAQHYNFAADALSVDGNVLGRGAADGINDFVDAFDDGLLTSPPTTAFSCLQPVTEGGGVLHLASADGGNRGTPGFIVDNCVLGASAGSPLRIRDGAGSSVATASFVANIPEAVQSYGLQLFTLGASERLVNVQILFGQAGPAAAAVARAPGRPQLTETVRVALAGRTRVLLRLSFDDSTNAVAAAYSLDGGATFSSIALPGNNVFQQGFEAVVSLFGAAADVARPAYPVVLVHGLCGSPETWQTMVDRVRQQQWISAATQTDALADVYVMAFADPIIRDGLNAWALQLRVHLRDINRFRARLGLPATPFILVSHSAGGLASREYIQRAYDPQNAIHHLVTYGTPHLGTPPTDWVFLLATLRRCQGINQADLAASLGVAEMNGTGDGASLSGFLSSLNRASFPAAIQHTSLRSAYLGCLLLLGYFSDCAVPLSSQNLANIAAPPSHVHVPIRTGLRHTEQPEDVETILGAINHRGIMGVDSLTIEVASPVDVILTDPLGRVVSKAMSAIPLAGYSEWEDASGDFHDRITLPAATPGRYEVRVLPDGTASRGETFSITAIRNGVPLSLAVDQRVDSIPSVPYSFTIDEVRTVGISVKPGNAGVPPINPKSQGTIPVAVLSSTELDVTTVVDRSSLTFGRAGFEESLNRCDETDTNDDGLLDLLCHFETDSARLQIGDRMAVLRGRTINGGRLHGTSAVRVLP